MIKKQPSTVTCGPSMKSATEAFLHPSKAVTHYHEWLYDVAERIALRYCGCGESYALCISQENNLYRFTWVKIEEV